MPLFSLLESRRLGAGFGVVALILLACQPFAGCDAIGEDVKEAFRRDVPDPTTAAGWMFHREPEKRRLGITWISNAPFGGEDVYLDVYRQALTDVDPIVRAAASHALGLHGEPDDAPALAKLLQDSSPAARWEAAKALQRIHNEVAVGPLLNSASSDSSADVRMAAADALGQYAEPRVAEGLITAIGDNSLTVNQHARRALRILTGQDFRYDMEAWLAWYRNADEPFAGRGVYRYPVYTRRHTLIEKFNPLGRPTFEEPGIPIGANADQR